MTILCPHCQSSAPEGAANCVVCGGPLASSNSLIANEALPHGTILQNGHFVLANTLGQGGFGITYAGGDAQLRRRVAIKELFPTGCTRRQSTVMPTQQMGLDDFSQVKARFLEESRVLARFSHPGIVQVYGSFEENNTAYMAMEYLEGEPLSKRLSERGCLPEAEAIALIEKIGAALTVIHGVNLIHRDIKPENIMLVRDGRAVLIDFGSARGFAAGHSRHMTSLFTPGYAPLEQYSKQARFGSYTDIYALGATLYHCLTGLVPPDATDRASGVELKPPSAINRAVSQTASDAVLWAMQMKIENRPGQIGEFLDVLNLKSFAQMARNRADREEEFELPPIIKSVTSTLDTKYGFITHASIPEAYDALIRAFHDCGVSEVLCAANHDTVSGTMKSKDNKQDLKLYGSVRHTSAGTAISVESRPKGHLTYVPLTVSLESRMIVRRAEEYLADGETASSSNQLHFVPRVASNNPADGSGLGLNSSLVPPRFGTFNVGAFFLSPLWCLMHGCWIGMLWFVPCLGFITPFITGFQGNTLAWQNRKWDSEEDFAKSQRIWAWCGVFTFILGLIALVWLNKLNP